MTTDVLALREALHQASMFGHAMLHHPLPWSECGNRTCAKDRALIAAVRAETAAGSGVGPGVLASETLRRYAQQHDAGVSTEHCTCRLCDTVRFLAATPPTPARCDRCDRDIEPFEEAVALHDTCYVPPIPALTGGD